MTSKSQQIISRPKLKLKFSKRPLRDFIRSKKQGGVAVPFRITKELVVGAALVAVTGVQLRVELDPMLASSFQFFTHDGPQYYYQAYSATFLGGK